MKVSMHNITIEKITKAMLFHHGEPFAASLQIAKHFGIAHNDLLKKIRAFHSYDELIKVGKISQLKRSYRGQEFPYFELDADAFSFTCLSITGKKAEAFKWVFIEAYKKATIEAISARVAIQCNKANDAWIEARKEGTDTRHTLSDKIKEFCSYAEKQRRKPYGANCHFFKNITDAIYKHLNIEIVKDGKQTRDTLSGEMIELLDEAEETVIELLDEVMQSNGSRHGINQLIRERLSQ